jgi:TPR repeat protein
MKYLAAAALACAGPAFSQTAPPSADAPQASRMSPELLAATEREAGPVLVALEKLGGKGARDTAGGLRLLREEAGKNNELATILLGAIYGDGAYGVPRDSAESIRWYRRLFDGARPGSPWRGGAAAALGTYYMRGEGIARDDAEAARLLKIAAEAGDKEGMTWYGIVLASGRGVPLDHAAAVRWLTPPAEGGDRAAMTMLGFLYERGDGVPRDPARALQLHRAAADKGSNLSATRAALLLLTGKDQDPKLAFHYAGIAAAGGESDAMAIFGVMHLNGIGTPVNHEEAVRWLRPAAEKGDAAAMLELVYAFARSQGKAVPQAEAHVWLRKSADLGNPRAMFLLAGSIERGFVPGTRDDAIGWYRKAAAKGDTKAVDALKRLGVAP